MTEETNTEPVQPDTEPEDTDIDPLSGNRTGQRPPQAEAADVAEPDDDAATFPREYVEKLRREAARYRDRARSADEYGPRLHTELVRATGRLADPSDLPFDPGHLDDPDALTTAIDELLTRKPHLASRRPSGEIGQGVTSSAATVDLAAVLRRRAM